MKKSLFAFGLMFVLASCAQYSLLEPKRTTIGEAYSVDPQIAWSRHTFGHNDLWTTDGPLLQQLRFVHGLKKGQTLFASNAVETPENWPKLKNQKRPSEIMEFVVDSLTALKANKVQATNLQPHQFGDIEGFRFDYRYNVDGLEHRGVAVGAQIGNAFQLILYSGAELHYFERNLETFERIVKSIQLA